MPIDALSSPFTNNIVVAPSTQDYLPLRNYSGNWTWISPTYFQSETEGVDLVTGEGNIVVNNTDPQTPIVSITATPTFTTVNATTVNATTVTSATLSSASTITISPTTYIYLNGGIRWKITNGSYGTTVTPSLSDCFINLTGGTGATTIDLSASFVIGSELTISDSDCIASTSNITIDAGVGKVIISNVAAGSQTQTISVDGSVVTIKKISTTSWKIV